MDSTCFARRSLAVLAILVSLLPAMGAAQEYFDHYGLTPASATVDLGVQPLGYPSGVISAVMQRDRILKKALAASLQPLKAHPFRRGADMVPLLANGRLEAGLLGDMPTLLAASTGSIWIVGLVKQTSTAIVSKGTTQAASLAGKRIGFVETSSAHLTLLQGLSSAGVSESQVTLIPVSVGDMPDALERGDIDAFAAWEPAPTIALAKSDKNHIVFRGLTSDYFVIEQAFAKRSPQAARHVVAGFVRAIEWMRLSNDNLQKAAQWALTDSGAFSGKAAALSTAQIANITRREILDIPSAPTILTSPGTPALKSEFLFLTNLKKLPAGGTWDKVATAFAYDGLARVLAEPRTYQVRSFDYEN
jgi:ABC-type nitrate/sulfonate/bicarbonate transport system substrate-binding protein